MTDDRLWLDTNVGNLRVAVIRRDRSTRPQLFEVAVFTAIARELDPVSARGSYWCLESGEIPNLGHGFLFAGCRAGILYARPLAAPTLEDVTGVVWELVHWAREPWQSSTGDDWKLSKQDHRRRRLARLAARVGFALTVVAVVGLLRRR